MITRYWQTSLPVACCHFLGCHWSHIVHLHFCVSLRLGSALVSWIPSGRWFLTAHSGDVAKVGYWDIGDRMIYNMILEWVMQWCPKNTCSFFQCNLCCHCIRSGSWDEKVIIQAVNLCTSGMLSQGVNMTHGRTDSVADRLCDTPLVRMSRYSPVTVAINHKGWDCKNGMNCLVPKNDIFLSWRARSQAWGI